MMAAREKQDPSQFFDLPFERFVSDPVRAIEEIYRAFDLAFTSDVKTAVERFRSDNPKGKHGEHAYSASQWGLDSEEIHERFRRYTDTYEVQLSPS